MIDPLAECATNLGEPPRSVSLRDRFGYLRVSKLGWARGFHTGDLATHFKHLGSVFRHGKVVWGHIIQANNLLFESGDDDCPGELVYSLDDGDRATPENLSEIARKLFALKGTKPQDSQLVPIADYLTDEMTRVFGMPVPASLSSDLRCKITTTYFVRKHLPNGRLCQSFMPLLVSPEEPHVAMVVPARYWPDDLLDQWSGGG